MLDYRVETFLTVCQTRNYTRAAQMLNITQPAVSQHIKYLEEYFGVKLFDMKGKIIYLTSEGEEVYHLARIFNLNITKFREHLLTDTGSKEISVGATKTIGEFIMPPIIAAYVKEYPNRIMKMKVDSTSTLLEKVKYGELDFAFIEGPFDEKEFNVLEFMEERYIPVCSPEFKLAGSEVTIHELMSYPLILKEESRDGRSDIEQWLLQINHSINNFKVVHLVDSLLVVKEMVKNNIGISCLYETSVREELLNGSLVTIPIKNYDVKRKFKFVYRKYSNYNQEYLDFFDFCDDQRRILCL